jgi:hypothetical protein
MHVSRPAASLVKSIDVCPGRISVKRAKLHPLKPRNPVATSPLLRKGGAHGKTSAAKRRQAKVDLARLQRDPDAVE